MDNPIHNNLQPHPIPPRPRPRMSTGRIVGIIICAIVMLISFGLSGIFGIIGALGLGGAGLFDEVFYELTVEDILEVEGTIAWVSRDSHSWVIQTEEHAVTFVMFGDGLVEDVDALRALVPGDTIVIGIARRSSYRLTDRAARVDIETMRHGDTDIISLEWRNQHIMEAVELTIEVFRIAGIVFVLVAVFFLLAFVVCAAIMVALIVARPKPNAV